MTEEFLHYIWQQKLYLHEELKTTANETIEVIHPGHKNSDAGPDFFNAKIRINNTLWAGNVEIHLSEDDWQNHRHHTDSAYDNVILHVDDKLCSGTLNSKGNKVSVCKVKYRPELTNSYNRLICNETWVPCQAHISKLEPLILHQWLERMLIEKLEEKSTHIQQLLQNHNNDWDQVFFILLARSFGFGTNGQPFELMARQTPLKALLKHADDTFQLEAILYGQSGFLNQKTEDTYWETLKNEYTFLSAKYGLKPINSSQWKFLRLRPSNFPTIRISQLANLLHQSRGQFSTYLQPEKLEELEKTKINASDYWQTRYTFGKATHEKKTKSIGILSKKRIIYNTILPYQFIYSSFHKQEKIKEKIVDIYYDKPPETNSILDNWKNIGIKINNEANAQALIFLKNHYCNHKKCLNCHIGQNVLSKSEE